MKYFFLPALGFTMLSSLGCTSIAQFPINEPATDTFNKGFVGKWKFEEDSNKNNYYEIEDGAFYHMDTYHIKFWDRGGKKRTIETGIHMTKLAGNIFISVPYLKRGEEIWDYKPSGYFFLRVIDINKDFTKMTTATVHDSTLWELNAAGIRQRIFRNLNNPAYYYDTVHFYKIR